MCQEFSKTPMIRDVPGTTWVHAGVRIPYLEDWLDCMSLLYEYPDGALTSFGFPFCHLGTPELSSVKFTSNGIDRPLSSRQA